MVRGREGGEKEREVGVEGEREDRKEEREGGRRGGGEGEWEGEGERDRDGSASLKPTLLNTPKSTRPGEPRKPILCVPPL